MPFATWFYTIIATIFDSPVNKPFVHVKIAYSCSSVITLIADMSDIFMNNFMFFQWILCIMFVATLITIKFYVCVHFLFVRLKAFSFKKYFPTFQTLKLFIAGDFQMSYLMLLQCAVIRKLFFTMLTFAWFYLYEFSRVFWKHIIGQTLCYKTSNYMAKLHYACLYDLPVIFCQKELFSTGRTCVTSSSEFLNDSPNLLLFEIFYHIHRTHKLRWMNCAFLYA